MLKDQFIQTLKEFTQLNEIDLDIDQDTDTAVISVDNEFILNISYLNDSDNILIFSPVGAYSKAEDKDGAKAIALLKLNDIGSICSQVTLMLDDEAELILAADRRNALNCTSIDALSTWLEIIINSVRSTRNYFAENFPLEE